MTANIHKIIVNGCKRLLEFSGNLPGGVGGGVGSVRLNQVDHRFRLGQVQLAVQKGPLGEFTPLGGPCACPIQGVQTCRQHGGGAMAVKFHRVLSRIAVGSAGDRCHTLVNGAALYIPQDSEDQLPVGRLRQGLPGLRGKDLTGNGNAVFT